MPSTDEWSLAQRVAALPPDQRQHVLDGLDHDALQWDWSFWGRPSQQLPADDSWSTVLYLGGRGSGKTRGGCEWVRAKARSMPGSRGIIVARTAADARDVLVDGDSGLLNIHPPSERPEWEPSKRRLTWPNGATATVFSAEQPDSLRGPQGHWALCDEVAAWASSPGTGMLDAWDQVRIATRLGANPQIVAMTTPRRVPVIKALLDEAQRNPRVVVRRSSTYANAGNLSPVYLEALTGLYGGTSLARQELDGDYLGDDVEGALWSNEIIDRSRVAAIPAEAPVLHIVGVDPSVAQDPRDACGIVVIACTAERDLWRRRIYVVEDATVHGSPEVWSRAVVEAARRWHGATVVAERNQGGQMVADVITQHDAGLRVATTYSRKSKAERAAPVVLAYERGNIHHVGTMPELEVEMTNWTPDVRKSPDRLDALVIACTAAAVDPPQGLRAGSLRAYSPGRSRLPATVGSVVGLRASSPASARLR